MSIEHRTLLMTGTIGNKHRCRFIPAQPVNQGHCNTRKKLGPIANTILALAAF